MLLAAAVLDAPDDPSGRGLLMVVAAVLVLALVTLHVRLLLRVAPRDAAEAGSAAGLPADVLPEDDRTADESTVDEPSAEGRSASVPFPTAPAPASAASAREPVDARLS